MTSDDCRMLPNDDNPQMASRPSWVNNPGYNHLNESGLTPSVADNSNEASRTENFEELPNNGELPVPWAKEEREEPLKSPSQNIISDKVESMVHSVHRCAPPSHHIIIPVGNSIAEEMEENEYLDEYAEGTGSGPNSIPNLQKQASIEASRPSYIRHHSASLMQDMVEESNTRKRIHEWLNTSEPDVQVSAAEGTPELPAKYRISRVNVNNKDSEEILNRSSNSIEESYL